LALSPGGLRRRHKHILEVALEAIADPLDELVFILIFLSGL
jgi:hypothetical protein